MCFLIQFLKAGVMQIILVQMAVAAVNGIIVERPYTIVMWMKDVSLTVEFLQACALKTILVQMAGAALALIIAERALAIVMWIKVVSLTV